MFDFDCLLKHIRSVTGENLSFETITDSLKNECHVVKFGNAIKKHWFNEGVTMKEDPSTVLDDEREPLYEINSKKQCTFINNICNNHIMAN